MSNTLTRLDETISARKAAGDVEGSHSAALLAKGPRKCAEKFGEEAVEAVIAAVAENKAMLMNECADVLYHMAVMLASRDSSLGDVIAVLEAREGVSGVEEKAGRQPA